MAQLYLKFEGGENLDGSVVRSGYDKGMMISNFSLGAYFDGDYPAEGDTDVQGNAAPSNIGISKAAGPESAGLIAAVLGKKVITSATISMDGEADGPAKPVLAIEIKPVVITQVEWSVDSSGGKASIQENLVLTYDAIKVTHTPLSGPLKGPFLAAYQTSKVASK